jgi:hypothetical protein
MPDDTDDTKGRKPDDIKPKGMFDGLEEENLTDPSEAFRIDPKSESKGADDFEGLEPRVIDLLARKPKRSAQFAIRVAKLLREVLISELKPNELLELLSADLRAVQMAHPEVIENLRQVLREFPTPPWSPNYKNLDLDIFNTTK